VPEIKKQSKTHTNYVRIRLINKDLKKYYFLEKIGELPEIGFYFEEKL